MSKPSKQHSNTFKNIGYRNAKFSVYTPKSNDQNSTSIGILLDDMFLWALSNWEQQTLMGPTVFIYPNREIFYGFFNPPSKSSKNLQNSLNTPQQSSQRLEGVWCFMVNNNNTETIKIFGNGPLVDKAKKQKNVAVCYGDSVGQIKIERDPQSQRIKYQMIEEIDCESQRKKWETIESYLKCRLDKEDKSLFAFIDTNFIQEQKESGIKINKLKLSSPYPKNSFLYHFENESLGAMIEFEKNSQGEETCIRVHQVGSYIYYEDYNGIQYGRKYSYKNGPVLLYNNAIQQVPISIEEGIFRTNQTCIYENQNLNRPNVCRKFAQKYYKQATEFSNKYIYMHDADSLYQAFGQIAKIYVEGSNTRNGQMILQRGKQNQVAERQDAARTNKEKENSTFEKNFSSRRSNKYGNQEYQLEEAKQKILREIANKKKGHQNPIYNYRERSRSRSRSRQAEIHYQIPSPRKQVVRNIQESPPRYYNYSNTSPIKKYTYYENQSPTYNPVEQALHRRYLQQKIEENRTNGLEIPSTRRYTNTQSHQIEERNYHYSPSKENEIKMVGQYERYDRVPNHHNKSPYIDEFTSRNYNKGYRRVHFNYTDDLKDNKHIKGLDLRRDRSNKKSKAHRRTYNYAE